MKDFIESLPTEKQIALAITFAQKALPIWESYATRSKCTYYDSVVGIKHIIDEKLPARTIESIKKYLINQDISFLLPLSEEFIEPIVALQDDDWKLPDGVLKTFYAIYNLLEGLVGNPITIFSENIFYVSVNQSADALLSTRTASIEEIRQLFA